MPGFDRKSAERIQRTVLGFERMTGVSGTGWYRRRFVRGGEGDPIVYGRLIKEVPANGTIEEAIELETFGTWFGNALDEDDEQIIVHAGNPSLYSVYRGSSGLKVRVWGVMRDAEVSIGGTPTVVQCFIIHGEFKDQLAAAEGHVTSPDNDKGQALIHHDGSNATVADGGPCGGA